MESSFKEVPVRDLKLDPFNKIGGEWMLITAEKDGAANTLTASRGGLGVFWGYDCAFIFIKDSRYTKESIDAADSFSISFLPAAVKKNMLYIGTVSGRDEDKIAKVGYVSSMKARLHTLDKLKSSLPAIKWALIICPLKASSAETSFLSGIPVRRRGTAIRCILEGSERPLSGNGLSADAARVQCRICICRLHYRSGPVQ